jgi:hypothetical protein
MTNDSGRWAVEIQDYRGETLWLGPAMAKRKCFEIIRCKMIEGFTDDLGLYHAPDKIFVRMGHEQRLSGQIGYGDELPIGADACAHPIDQMDLEDSL